MDYDADRLSFMGCHYVLVGSSGVTVWSNFGFLSSQSSQNVHIDSNLVINPGIVLLLRHFIHF